MRKYGRIPDLLSLGVFILGFGPTEIRAELLYFAKGGELQAPVTINDDTVVVEAPAGRFEFRRSDFRRLVPGYSPSAEWDSRKKPAMLGGAAKRFQAAWWALENGLTPEAESMLRATLAADPMHQPAGRMVAVLDQLAKPGTDPDVAPLQRALGDHVQFERGPHVLLLHQHSAEEAAERVEMLERVLRTYYLIFAAQGVELSVSNHRFASGWFAEQGDYRAFLRSEHAGVFLSTQGYYHPTLKVVVAHDVRSIAAEKSARLAIEARRRQLDALAETVVRMSPTSRSRITFPGEPTRTLGQVEAKELIDRLGRDLNRQRLLWETRWRALDLGTAAHEMVHQLMAASGLPTRHDDFPTWLHEGFAAQFEVIRGGRWAGVSRAHDLRLTDWRAIKAPLRLTSLIRDEGFGHGYKRDLYASSWALVYFLRKRHPQEFQTYLDLLHNPRDDEVVDRGPTAFRSVFGESLDSLEAEWRAFLSGVTTPLESLATPSTASRPIGMP